MIRTPTTTPVRRLLVMIDTLDVGGAQRLVELQALHVPEGTRIAVVSFGPETDLARRLRERGAEVWTGRLRRLFDPQSIRRLTREISRWRPHVIHSHLPYAMIVGGMVARRLKVPHVVTLHNERPERPEGVGLADRVRARLEILSLRYGTDAAIACGPRVATAHAGSVGRTPLITIANRIAPIPAPTSAERAAHRSTLGVGAGQALIVGAGRLVWEKGFDLLLDALAALGDRSDYRLVLAGSGPDEAALRQQIARLDLGDVVQMAGAVPDLPSLLAVADIFALSSRSEGLPLVLIEAMATGCSIVATRVGDVATVVNNDSALLVAPNSVDALAGALDVLLGDAEKRKALGSAALEASGVHTDIAEYIAQLDRVYDLVTGRHGIAR